MLKIGLIFKTFTNFTGKNSSNSRIKNAKFLWYCFHMNKSQLRGFKICISVHLKNEEVDNKARGESRTI